MKADERKIHEQQLEENALARRLNDMADRVKSGQVINYRVLGIALAIVFAVGLWWYLSGQRKQQSSQAWAVFEASGSGVESLQKFADDNKDTPAGRAARLDAARILLGPQGQAQVNTYDTERRKKAIENIEKARDQFVKLADEFPDTTLKVQSLLGAAEAELALVGVLKDNSPTEFRGSVDKVAEHYDRVAQVAGEATTVGKQAKERAEDLRKNRQQVIQVTSKLYSMVNPVQPSPFTAPPSLTPPGGTPNPSPPAPDIKAPPTLPTPDAKGSTPPATPEKKDAPPPPPEKKDTPAPPPTPPGGETKSTKKG